MQSELLNRTRIRDLMAQVAANHGHALPADDDAALRDINFRSLDFSELALRVEDEIGRELNFDAPELRGIRTIADVLDLLVLLQAT
jgi:acyl carrier protein